MKRFWKSWWFGIVALLLVVGVTLAIAGVSQGSEPDRVCLMSTIEVHEDGSVTGPVLENCAR